MLSFVWKQDQESTEVAKQSEVGVSHYRLTPSLDNTWQFFQHLCWNLCFQTAQQCWRNQNNLSSTLEGAMNSWHAALLSCTGHTSTLWLYGKFLVRKAEDFSLGFAGQVGVLACKSLPAPGCTSCTASLHSPPFTPRAGVPAMSRSTTYMVYFSFFLNSKKIDTSALLPKSHRLPWEKTSANLPLLRGCRWSRNRNNSWTGYVLPPLQLLELWCLFSNHPVPAF